MSVSARVVVETVLVEDSAGAAGLGRRRARLGWGLAVLGLAALTGVLLAVDAGGSARALEAMLYLSLAVAVALVGGRWPALAAAVVGALLLNYFFIPPRRTLNVSSGNDVATLLVFAVTAVAVAAVVDAAARRRQQARLAEQEAGTLAMLNRQVLGGEYDVPRLLVLARDTFGADSAELVTEEPLAVPGSVVLPAGAGGWLVLQGADLGVRRRPVAAAFASHVGVLREREELARQSMAAQQLEAGNRTRTALLAAVSHDLRTPLAGLRSATETLRVHDTRLDETERKELLAAMESSIARLTGMVSDLLDMSRLQTGAVLPIAADVPLGEVVRRALAGLEEAERVVVGELPTAYVDAGLLERVVANLVANALRHSDAVRVEGSTDGARVELRVVDRGPGVAPEDRARIFEPFQRRGDSGTGVGLGLAVARGLTEAQGGTLEAESTPGGGLTMVLEAPRSRRMKVLLVDDDTTLRRTLGIGLRAEGHDVLIAADGRTALQALRDDRPDIVVLDLGLPDLSGMEVLRQLRGWSTTPVVVLSARAESSEKVKALDLGADDYVTKPFGMEELLARIRAAARRAGSDLPVLDAGDLVIDLPARRVTKAGEVVRLTPTEWGLLEMLVRTPGRLVSQQDLLHEVWGPTYGRETNYLRVYVGALRKKLEDDPAVPRHLITEPGMGYRFEV